MATRFENQVVWITGGGSGIGRELALAFAKEGATVAISGRRQDRLGLVVGEIQINGGSALAIPCDVTDETSVERAVEQIVETLGRLDVAVANAGVSVIGTVEKLSAEDWRRQLDVNVVGLALTARYSIPHLKAHGGRSGSDRKRGEPDHPTGDGGVLCFEVCGTRNRARPFRSSSMAAE